MKSYLFISPSDLFGSLPLKGSATSFLKPGDLRLGIDDDTPTCPNAVKSCQYSYQFSTIQRQNLLAWSLKGSLPLGLVLKNDGIISGIPQQAGTFEFIVEVIDSKGKWDEFPVFLTVEEPQSSEISIK
jgi:hypothetical protein